MNYAYLNEALTQSEQLAEAQRKQIEELKRELDELLGDVGRIFLWGQLNKAGNWIPKEACMDKLYLQLRRLRDG